ncbi:MAG: RNA polymerase sigma factor [Candidatus Dormibacteria bacterium]|jgi:RNA polymerase sigma factor (sigma-70 family)
MFSTYRPGSDSDFDRLYRDNYSKVLQTVAAIVGTGVAAEDCAQETFERAYAAWPRFRPEAPAPVWLQRIAVNVAVTERRRSELRQVKETIRRFGQREAIEDAAARVEDMDLLGALRSLPPRQAAVIVLRHLHGYTNREIAVAIGIPERTVASRLASAKRNLAARLGGASSGASIQSRSEEQPAANAKTLKVGSATKGRLHA